MNWKLEFPHIYHLGIFELMFILCKFKFNFDLKTRAKIRNSKVTKKKYQWTLTILWQSAN